MGNGTIPTVLEAWTPAALFSPRERESWNRVVAIERGSRDPSLTKIVVGDALVFVETNALKAMVESL